MNENFTRDMVMDMPSEISLGETQLTLENFEEAKKLFEKAVQVSPYCWQAH